MGAVERASQVKTETMPAEHPPKGYAASLDDDTIEQHPGGLPYGDHAGWQPGEQIRYDPMPGETNDDTHQDEDLDHGLIGIDQLPDIPRPVETGAVEGRRTTSQHEHDDMNNQPA